MYKRLLKIVASALYTNVMFLTSKVDYSREILFNILTELSIDYLYEDNLFVFKHGSLLIKESIANQTIVEYGDFH